jgi:hypothetical protein
MGHVAAGAVLVGAGLQAYAQYERGRMEAAALERNARLARYQEADAKQQGALEAGRLRAEGSAAASAARVAAAESGVDPYSGTVANVIASSGANASVAAARVKSNAARAQWGYAQEEANLREQARAAKRAGYLGAFGTGIGGAGSAAGTYATTR